MPSTQQEFGKEAVSGGGWSSARGSRARPTHRLLIAALAAVLLAAALAAQAPPGNPSPNNPRSPSGAAAPPETGGHDRLEARFPDEYRTLDGRGNNGLAPRWGAANTPLLRRMPAAYEDGAGRPAGGDRLGAREISNLCVAQEAGRASRASAFLWQWGQFLDHDISLTPIAAPSEPFAVAVPTGDPWFDPLATGRQTIALERSGYRTIAGVREQLNTISAFIDASNVYGTTRARARALRANDGSGRLATSEGDLLPFNTRRLPNAPGRDPSFFIAGDFRANEQVGLTALHTLFVREHNFWVEAFQAADPTLDGDTLYEHARAIVGAEMQAITYRQFLPMLLGRRALGPYRGYDPTVDPGVENVFATAAYRVGHSMLPTELLRLDGDGAVIPAGHLSLAAAFFNPRAVVDHGIDSLLRGLAAQRAQRVDPQLVDEVRNFLFGPPGAGGFDLAALNIQRGRDHGLPDYNSTRVAYGLPPVTEFAQIHPDPAVQSALAAAYESVDAMDLWVAGLAERHVRGAQVGETFHAILSDQFERLRAGDRFWYQSYLPPDLVRLVERQTLARIIRRNTTIGGEIQANVFRARRRG